jgi:hypothetical protein
MTQICCAHEKALTYTGAPLTPFEHYLEHCLGKQVFVPVIEKICLNSY